MRVLGLAILALSGCVSPIVNLKAERPFTLESAKFVIKSDGHSEKDVARLEKSLERVPLATARWGALAQPVTVYIVRNHAELEAAVGRFGFDWLRAWSTFDELIIQAPITWTAVQDVVDELVIHEVTHNLLFQASADANTWLTREIPLWFREGMAISTASQQGRYPSLEDSAQWLEKGLDPFGDGERLSKNQSTEVYGVGLHAFEFLVRKHGDEKIRALMAAMHAGDVFGAAFEKAIGISVDDFVKSFREFMKQREFRQLRKTVPVSATP
ncbi:MAG: hypothetical protein JNM17_35935 [Archangium sp.]|nr:hypothetical protein [Archangium sp.]